MNLPALQLSEFIQPNSFFVIAGPCAVESEEITFETARKLKEITQALQIPFIFKASFKKANRTTGTSFSGIDENVAISILSNVRKELNIYTLTDVHETTDVVKVADAADVLQIPAFLCRQTDLIVEAAKSGKPVNIKKGQFASSDTMRFAVEKVLNKDNKQVMVTERGTFLGYNDLVVDYRNIADMATFTNVVFDATHSFQKPNGAQGFSGGDNKYMFPLAKAAIICGAKGIFFETHPNPSKALSDRDSLLPLDKCRDFLEFLLK